MDNLFLNIWFVWELLGKIIWGICLCENDFLSEMRFFFYNVYYIILSGYFNNIVFGGGRWEKREESILNM